MCEDAAARFIAFKANVAAACQQGCEQQDCASAVQLLLCERAARELRGTHLQDAARDELDLRAQPFRQFDEARGAGCAWHVVQGDGLLPQQRRGQQGQGSVGVAGGLPTAVERVLTFNLNAHGERARLAQGMSVTLALRLRSAIGFTGGHSQASAGVWLRVSVNLGRMPQAKHLSRQSTRVVPFRLMW